MHTHLDKLTASERGYIPQNFSYILSLFKSEKLKVDAFIIPELRDGIQSFEQIDSFTPSFLHRGDPSEGRMAIENIIGDKAHRSLSVPYYRVEIRTSYPNDTRKQKANDCSGEILIMPVYPA